MKRGLIVAFILVNLILISNIIAYQSTISVKTGMPNKEIIFKACDQVNGKTIPDGEFRQKADSKGIVVFDYNLEPVLIKMSFMAWNGNSYNTFLNGKETIFLQNVILNEFVAVDLNKAEPSWTAYSNNSKEETTNKNVEVQVNISENATENIENETNDSEIVTIQKNEGNVSLTGAVISYGRILNSKIIYYAIIGIFVIGILFFTVIVIRRRANSNTPIRVTPLSEIMVSNSNNEIEEAERRVEEARRRLEEVRNKNGRIEEARKRLEQDKRELEELERQQREKENNFY